MAVIFQSFLVCNKPFPDILNILPDQFPHPRNWSVIPSLGMNCYHNFVRKGLCGIYYIEGRVKTKYWCGVRGTGCGVSLLQGMVYLKPYTPYLILFFVDA